MHFTCGALPAASRFAVRLWHLVPRVFSSATRRAVLAGWSPMWAVRVTAHLFRLEDDRERHTFR